MNSQFNKISDEIITRLSKYIKAKGYNVLMAHTSNSFNIVSNKN